MNEFEEACSLLAPLFGLALARLTDVEALVLVNVDFYAVPQVDVAKKLKRTRCNVCRTRRRGFDKFSAACNELIDQSPRRGFLREMLSSQAFRRELVVVMEQSIRRRLACPEESIHGRPQPCTLGCDRGQSVGKVKDDSEPDRAQPLGRGDSPPCAYAEASSPVAEAAAAHDLEITLDRLEGAERVVLGTLAEIIRTVEVVGPFQDIPDDVMQPRGVGPTEAHWAGLRSGIVGKPASSGSNEPVLPARAKYSHSASVGRRILPAGKPSSMARRRQNSSAS